MDFLLNTDSDNSDIYKFYNLYINVNLNERYAGYYGFFWYAGLYCCYIEVKNGYKIDSRNVIYFANSEIFNIVYEEMENLVNKNIMRHANCDTISLINLVMNYNHPTYWNTDLLVRKYDWYKDKMDECIEKGINYISTNNELVEWFDIIVFGEEYKNITQLTMNTNIVKDEPQKIIYSYDDFINIKPELFDCKFSCDECDKQLDKLDMEELLELGPRKYFLASKMYFNIEKLNNNDFYSLCNQCYQNAIENYSIKEDQFIKPELNSEQYLEIMDKAM